MEVSTVHSGYTHDWSALVCTFEKRSLASRNPWGPHREEEDPEVTNRL